MAFEELKGSTKQIREETKAYADKTIRYYKLWGFQFAMKSARMIVRMLLLSFFLLMALIFASVAAAIAIGDALHSAALGFLIVAGAYVVLGILLAFLRLRFIERRILRKCSALFFR